MCGEHHQDYQIIEFVQQHYIYSRYFVYYYCINRSKNYYVRTTICASEPPAPLKNHKLFHTCVRIQSAMASQCSASDAGLSIGWLSSGNIITLGIFTIKSHALLYPNQLKYYIHND